MLCGDFESENTSILQGYDVCYDCVENLIDNEVERRGERAERQAFEAYWGGTPTAEDRERQQLKDAGRIK